MKFFLTFAAVVAVATASPTQRVGVSAGATGPAPVIFEPHPIAIGPAIIDSFEPIAIGPAIVDSFEPIAIGPAIVDTESFPVGAEDVSVGPAIIDFPIPDGGAVSAPVDAAPVANPASGSLVQIIINVNAAAAGGVVAESVVNPVEDVPEAVQVVDSAPEPVQVVDSAPEPIQIVDSVPEPVQVVDVAAIEPVQVVDVVPVVVEPVQIGAPIIPVPAVNLPEELN